MKRQIIQSSIIAAVAYDPSESILEVEFTDGKIKQYLKVSLETYNGLMSAGSHGRYFLSNIRGKHESKRISA